MKVLIVLASLLLMANIGIADPHTEPVILGGDTLTTADSNNVRDTIYSDIIQVLRCASLSYNYEIWDDSNFTNDTLIIQLQHSNSKGCIVLSGGKAVDPKWRDVPGVLPETTLIGAPDTIKNAATIVSRDSLFGYIRFQTIHSVTLDSTKAKALAGNAYNWYLRFYTWLAN